ncbi:MAG TPA: SGNH/GDSL hydrolase family protein [Clostridiales bacterium]|nr:SGNH/GDSL hydrolase family protein [Clostridiales bacterium]
MKKRRIWIRITAVCCLIISIFFLQKLLMPKYVTSIIEGSLIEEYYREKTPHDVIFIGDCEVYENISPITLWEKYGITSFIRGSAQQLIWHSYYLLEETLKYEKPKVVVFNVLSMKYNEPQKEEYNRLTLDGMRWSMSKVKAIKASMMEGESFLDYVFPILRFHSRWSELTSEDFKYLFKKDKVSHNGYYMRVDVKPVTSVPKPRKLADYRFGDNAWHYLDKMVELTKKHGIELVLMKAPTIYPHWYDEWEQQIEEYAEKHDLMYINFLELMEETGIDLTTTDTYDAGLHLNKSGAEKLSVYFGKILQDTFGLEDHRSDEELSLVWQEKVEFYRQMAESQYNELKEYGYLKRFRNNN